MKAFLAMVMMLSLGVALHAQPQAPVVWGEARWAHLAGWPGLPQITTLRVIPMGDTLLFTALQSGGPVSDTVLVCSSFDNGETFTPWIRVTDGHDMVHAHFTGSAGRYYCFVNGDYDFTQYVWLRVSEDGGRTWGPPLAYRDHASALVGFASGSEVLARFGSLINNNWSTCAFWSDNGGQGWTLPMVIDTADFYMYNDDQSIAFTSGHCLILEQPLNDYHLYLARSDRTWQNWTTFEPLPGNPRTSIMAIYGDTATETAGILAVTDGDSPTLFRTTDGGETWGNYALGDAGDVPTVISNNVPLLVGDGKLWMTGWERDDPQGWNFVSARFSANHGKSWYPPQIPADSVYQAIMFSGQIRGRQIDLYWNQWCWDSLRGLDYRMVTGTITPDTVPPVVAVTLVGPDTIRVGDTLRFDGAVFDNDTLSEVRLVVLDSAEQRSVVALAYMGNHVFEGSFIVPSAGQFRYRGEAEDFWENISTYPDSGWLSFVTEGWSAAGNFIPHPSSLSFSVSPNPFNNITQIEFTLPSTQRVSLRLYDVLGREVAVLMNEIQTAGRHHVMFDASGLPSGVYLCRLEAGKMAQTRKIVLLK